MVTGQGQNHDAGGRAGTPAAPRASRVAPGSAIAILERDTRYARSSFPSDEVYGPTPAPELRVITYGGLFNPPTQQYSDNVIVFGAANQSFQGMSVVCGPISGVWVVAVDFADCGAVFVLWPGA